MQHLTETDNLLLKSVQLLPGGEELFEEIKEGAPGSGGLLQAKVPESTPDVVERFNENVSKVLQAMRLGVIKQRVVIVVTHGKGVFEIAKGRCGGAGLVNYCSITGLRMKGEEGNGEEEEELILDNYGKHSPLRFKLKVSVGHYVR